MKPTEVFDSFCPQVWSRLKAVRLFSNATERAREGDVQLSASQKFGVVPQSKLMEEEDTKYMLALSGTDNFKHVQKDDFVISLRSFEGGFEHSAYEGCVSPAYTVLRPKAKIYPGYWRYLFKSSIFKDVLAAFNVGIRDGKSIRYDDFSQFLLAVPSLDSQQTIATYLDGETARIDALVEKKTLFIDLLREKRHALVTHAVTKGLDPSVPMKDSGVEWLGVVPAQWMVHTLSRVTISRCDGPFGSAIKSETYSESGVRVVRLQNIGFNEFKGDDVAYIPADYKQNEIGSGHDVLPDDLLMAGLGDDNNFLGRVCVAPEDIGETIVKADCYRFRVNTRKVTPRFLAYQLSATSKNECGFISTGSTRARLNLSLAASRMVAIPPTLAEQRDIANWVERSMSAINSLIMKCERSIELLKEHRSALITAAVTGQIDLQDTFAAASQIDLGTTA
ncbi:restriction endonuclease subunit S domain-containing protein [Paraburkholderia atlantica]|uniref:hypothetical protein n=1 Tax=Paraburkholderia atlantica TaxID=2654982 RepID=UPI00039BBE15|nr:hypothetical protein [Paraburkholderia atlantica]